MISEYVAPTELEIFSGVVFYKDVAPTALHFSSEKFLRGGNE